MSLLSLRIAPDPCLSITSRPVEEVDHNIQKLLDDMLETMYENNGCGLAANQVGILKRLVVIDISDDSTSSNPIKLINPEILWVSERKASISEGCLSVPDQYAEISRPAEAHIRYLDEYGCSQEIKGDGLLAACIQHEIDHLNGTLFIDHLSALKRNLILRKVQKQLKNRAL
ncbi:MAG: peptide deformylase [Alphaproteobacteria bacterium]|nr:peptide deformylase [Alphaproteobacteria bacterium]